MDLLTILYVSSLFSTMFSVISGHNLNYNVLSFGAVGNGFADDTQAFEKAWKATCNDNEGTPSMIIPSRKTFLVHTTNFLGPCKAQNINIVISGTIIAPEDPNYWKGKDYGTWLGFQYVNGLNISGGGLLDGRGERWWQISCRYHPVNGCNNVAPTILSFAFCNNLKMSGIRAARSGGTHFVIYGSENVKFRRLNLQSPESSPNTDGIKISHSRFVSIHRSVIGSGDDCISLLDATYHISITQVVCGPGHGISIGSLGRNGEKVDVEDITVSNTIFYKTTNGARIKTWQAGSGQVRNIRFLNIRLREVENPIIIDQYYGEKDSFPRKLKTGIRISNVQYNGFFGTSTSQVAINLNCSNVVPCTNIRLQNIEVKPAKSGDQVTATCNNAYGFGSGFVEPRSCLLRS